MKKGGEAGPASLRMHLIDTLCTLTEHEMKRHHIEVHITKVEQ